jgi:hypothetical protein
MNSGVYKYVPYQILLIPEGGDLGFFLYEKRSQGKKVLLQDM